MKKRLQTSIDDFLDYLYSVRGYSSLTIDTYQINLEQLLNFCEYYKEDEYTVLDIMPLRLHISTQNKRSIAQKLSSIRSLVKYLREQKGINIKLLGDSSIKVPQTLPKPIDEKYIFEVMESLKLGDRLLLSMLYGLGLRISELSSLELDSISKQWITVTGKGRKQRQLPLLPHIHNLLTQYIEDYKPRKYLFEKNNTPLNNAQLRYRINKIFKAHGIKATPHQLRHSFATHLLHHGARISDVSKLLGHSSMATTQIYTKLASSKKMQDYTKAHPLMSQE